MLTKYVAIANKATHHVVYALVSISLFALYNVEGGGEEVRRSVHNPTPLFEHRVSVVSSYYIFSKSSHKFLKIRTYLF
jgi:hypothetical protein